MNAVCFCAEHLAHCLFALGLPGATCGHRHISIHQAPVHRKGSTSRCSGQGALAGCGAPWVVTHARAIAMDTREYTRIVPKIKKSWNWEFWASKIMQSGFYYTKMKRKRSIKPFKILFKYNFTIKLQKNAIII